MDIKIPTAAIQATLTEAAKSALTAEQQLATSAQAQVQSLTVSLYPLMMAMAQEQISSKDPSVSASYIAVLQGVVKAKVSELALSAIATQAEQLAAVYTVALKVLAMVIKAAVV